MLIAPMFVLKLFPQRQYYSEAFFFYIATYFCETCQTRVTSRFSALLLTVVGSASLLKRVRQANRLMDTGFSHLFLKNQAFNKLHYGQGRMLRGSLKTKN